MMSDKSKIEWLDGGASWNPITGCTPISEGCVNCYAKTIAETRLRGMFGYDKEDPFKVTFHEDKLDQPLKWKRPRKIFVSSMGDLFHEDVKDSILEQVFEVIDEAKWHTFLILTKRPERMRLVLECFNTKNVWAGVTAENQRTADERIPTLLCTPAVKRFVSVEPILSAVNLRPNDDFSDRGHGPSYLRPSRNAAHWPGLDWVICGAETGPHARPMSLEWARDLRDQCADANVPFFFKKAGPTGTLIPLDLMIREYPDHEQ